MMQTKFCFWFRAIATDKKTANALVIPINADPNCTDEFATELSGGAWFTSFPITVEQKVIADKISSASVICETGDRSMMEKTDREWIASHGYEIT